MTGDIPAVLCWSILCYNHTDRGWFKSLILDSLWGWGGWGIRSWHHEPPKSKPQQISPTTHETPWIRSDLPGPVGPPYAVVKVEPALGPITGNQHLGHCPGDFWGFHIAVAQLQMILIYFYLQYKRWWFSIAIWIAGGKYQQISTKWMRKDASPTMFFWAKIIVYRENPVKDSPLESA